jgi:tetratricopeptide (TPR) repeat protein
MILARQPGLDHRDTLTTMNNLALVYLAAGRVDLALPLFEETLKLHKAEFGPDHADTLATMNNLAGAYLAAGKQDLALPLFEETLKIRKVSLGPDHPDTLGSIKNLEVVRYLAAANERYRAKLAELGPKHIDTLLARRDLAQAHMDVKNLDAAEPILVEVLQGMTARRSTPRPNRCCWRATRG